MERPADIQTPARSKGMRRHAFTVLKIAIAVVAIWWVLRGVSWYDAGELPAGAEINAVKFLEPVKVRVWGQQPAGGGGVAAARAVLVHIEFPRVPVKVEVDGREQQLVIDQNTP